MNIKKKFDYNIFFTAIVFFVNLIIFYNIEPNIDQIRHISWAQNLSNSEYFIDWNRNFHSKEIFFDNKSFFVNLFKTSYSDIGNLFNIVPILLLYLLSFISSNEIYTFNILSIFFYSVNILLTILILKEVFGNEFNKISYGYVLIFKLSLISFYSFYFSPLGLHNIALFFFLLTILFVINGNFYKSKKNLFFIFFFICLAIYTHKTNVILLIPPILLYFLLLKKFKLLSISILNISFILSPALIAYLLNPEIMESTSKFAEIDFDFYTYINNIFIWFYSIIKTSGPITLFFFFIGMYFIIQKSDKYLILFTFIIVHFLLNIFLNSFSYYYLRTYLYITPLILIIAIFGFYYIIKKSDNSKIFSYFIIILFSFNIIANFSLIVSKKLQNYVNPKIINSYYKYNNKIYPFLLKNKEYFSDKNIIFFDNSTEDYFKVYMKDLYLNNNDYIKPIKNLIVRNQDNINLSNLNLEKLILLSISVNEKQIIDDLKRLDKSKNFFSTCAIFKNSYLDIQKKIINGEYNLYIHQLNCTNS